MKVDSLIAFLFFSQISPLGEIGTYILNRLEKQSKDYILFKHHYIKNALNDYNIIDLLYAIKIIYGRL